MGRMMMMMIMIVVQYIYRKYSNEFTLFCMLGTPYSISFCLTSSCVPQTALPKTLKSAASHPNSLTIRNDNNNNNIALFHIIQMNTKYSFPLPQSVRYPSFKST